MNERYVDYRELIAQSDLDIVAILTMDHGDIAEAAAEAGKHLLVEKPFCFDPAEGYRILSAVERNGVKLMVGYMKLYDPGYEYGMERMRAMEDVRLIRVHDFAGDFTVHEPLYTLVTGDDIPQDLLDEGAANISAKSAAALGTSHAHLTDLYNMLLIVIEPRLGHTAWGIWGAERRTLQRCHLTVRNIVRTGLRSSKTLCF